MDPTPDVPAGGAPHLPVMAARVVELLLDGLRPGPALIVDATIGAAGHAAALLAARADLHLVGFDRDPDALALAERRLAAYAGRVTLVHSGYDQINHHVTPVVEHADVPPVGVLYDLGVSSMQLDQAQRGFSFRAEAPLDMRMDPTSDVSAANLVNELDVDELVDLIRRYGEERQALRIARAIVAARPLRTTTQLADVVYGAVPAAVRRNSAVHPATRTFQALRIAVNRELERFEASLPQASDLLAQGGRIAVLSYHSLEDRITKRFFSDAATGCICPPDLPVCGCGRVPLLRPVTRGAEQPDGDEVAANPRARSAKLRAAERVRANDAFPLVRESEHA
ncbi:MAG TPA: 16S rRNA (cytosine(1402)-N(4))-methyltransferase RsmH [Egibacteraceae bacterium]|nr:16S rRNA (cytosine(1402)-N(4))-methyltransferase RsmH [Egibacteraceae bacterium]